MEAPQTTSKRVAWVIIGSAVVVFVLISVMLYLLFGTKPEDQTNTKNEVISSDETVATEEEIKADIDSLEDALREAKNDRNEAKQSANGDDEQVLLSE